MSDPHADPRRRLRTMLRDLLTTIALCHLITLGLLRCIALHTALFVPAATCALLPPDQTAHSAHAHLTDIPQLAVLKVTAGCSLAAFAALELCLLLARRVRTRMCQIDAESGARPRATALPPDKPLEKSYFGA
ncbi:hypothetical protein B0H15DRAFT_291803 [Mycena belliarum]|uniref:Uncharacterized protein n=1 Tax=Mycena belliarum TaxID=1033014 RepID=A0AAD6XQX4_9AGAR|nr:hypothetical protein B0H15DRAFT_291803 [Mycena belliae]